MIVAGSRFSDSGRAGSDFTGSAPGGRGPTERDATGRDATGRDATGRDPAGKDAAGRAGAGSAPVVGVRDGAPVVWQAAEETPVALVYNGRSHAVMLATPLDLEDFVVGFSLTEEIIAAPSDVDGLEIRETAQGWVAEVRVDPALLLDGVRRRRTLAGRSGCGLCGVQSLAEAVRETPPRAAAPFALTAAAAERALAALPDHQPLNRENRSVHAAGWADAAGNLIAAREDVGRHNALDKLIGAAARQGVDFTAGFVVMSSRCSFELTQKAATMGIGALATLSAPTASALRTAAAAGLTLATADRNGVVLFPPADIPTYR